MAYFVKKEGKGLPLFTGTFQQVVKFCLKSQKQGLLQHHHYEIHGSELKHDPKEFVCDFFADDVGADLV
jgi:hypothetical protein